MERNRVLSTQECIGEITFCPSTECTARNAVVRRALLLLIIRKIDGKSGSLRLKEERRLRMFENGW
jgi:hypothetical protein